MGDAASSGRSGSVSGSAAKQDASAEQSLIRNFSIIAHIDHGKSTLADRLLEKTHSVEQREMKEQLLDQMDLEREKGITIKLQPVRMMYHHQKSVNRKQETEDGEVKGDEGKAQMKNDEVEFQLNLIDTPGHVDFSYEVSRSLQACDGALLVVDATQGIQAQTLANVYLAIEQELELIPVLNKIDLPAANVERVSKEIISLLGCTRDEIIEVSAKTGKNVEQVLEAIVKRVPQPETTDEDHTQALIFDSLYDEYRGVILYARVFAGYIAKNSDITMMGSGAEGIALEVGSLNPKMTESKILETGEIGYIVTNLRSVAEARVGDTVTLSKKPAPKPLPGYKKVTPFVYAGLFPASSDDYHDLKDALEKLALNDASLVYEPENSQILGFGFRVGFLGLLHLEIVKARLERHYDIEVIITNPSTDYRVTTTTGEELELRSATELPDPATIEEIREPWIKGEIIVPKDYVGNAIQLVVAARGQQKNINYMDEDMSLIGFEAPLANMLTDFYDQLKSTTSGYGTLSYELDEYRPEDLVRLDILIGGERMDSLSIMTHRSEAQATGRQMLKKLKEVIPRQLFEVALQAAIGGKIIAREDIKALGKNVTGHLYGGDVSRKKKLWAKQKAGKERMKKFGKVDIPNEAFTVLLKKDQ